MENLQSATKEELIEIIRALVARMDKLQARVVERPIHLDGHQMAG